MNTPTPDTAAALAATLLPCPFCGSKTPTFERLGTPRQSCIVVCGDCGCRHESSDEGARNGTSWNTRAALASQPAPQGAEPGFPTRAMMDVGAQCCLRDDDPEDLQRARGQAIDCYTAMLAAAPGAGLAGSEGGASAFRHLIVARGRVPGNAPRVGFPIGDTRQSVQQWLQDNPAGCDVLTWWADDGPGLGTCTVQTAAEWLWTDDPDAAAPQQVAAEAPTDKDSLTVQARADALGDLATQQKVLDWNRAQPVPPIVIGREYAVVSQVAEHLRAVCASQWKPADTAPDGECVLVYMQSIDAVDMAFRNEETGRWTSNAGTVWPDGVCTVWMPLPASPAASIGQSMKG